MITTKRLDIIGYKNWIPSVIKNKSAFEEETTTTERKEKWIQATSKSDA